MPRIRRRKTTRTTPHVHDDFDVSPERLAAFAQADRVVQIATLAVLRERAGDDDNHLMMSFAGIFVAVLVAATVAPAVVTDPDLWWVSPITTFVVGIVLLLALLPSFLPAILASNRRQRAIVWVAAYEDELARWRTMPGRAGRAWRKAH